MHHNYWACAREPGNCNCWATCWTTEASTPRACALRQEKPLQWEAQAMQLEKSPHSNKDPAQPHTHTQRSHMPQVKAKTKPKKNPVPCPQPREPTVSGVLWLLPGFLFCKIKCNLIPSVPFYTKHNTVQSVTHLPFFIEPCDPADLFLSVHQHFLILSTLIACVISAFISPTVFFELTLAGLLVYFYKQRWEKYPPAALLTRAGILPKE